MFKYLPLLKRRLPILPRTPSELEQTRGILIHGPLTRYLTDADHGQLRHYFDEMVTVEEIFNHVLMRFYELKHTDLDDIFGMIAEDIPMLYYDDDPMVDVVAAYFDEYCRLILGMHEALMKVVPDWFIQPPDGMTFEQTLWRYVEPTDKTSDIVVEIIFVHPG